MDRAGYLVVAQAQPSPQRQLRSHAQVAPQVQRRTAVVAQPQAVCSQGHGDGGLVELLMVSPSSCARSIARFVGETHPAAAHYTARGADPQ